MAKSRHVPKIGEVRFVCWVTPASAVEEGARKYGWAEDGDTSCSEFIEPENYETATIFKSLAAAVGFGQRYCTEGLDYWGEARVYHQSYQFDDDTQQDEWQSIHVYAVSGDGIDNNWPAAH